MDKALCAASTNGRPDLVDGIAKSVRVIGKDDQERLAPLPEAFGHVFGFWKRVIAGQVVRRSALCDLLVWLGRLSGSRRLEAVWPPSATRRAFPKKFF